jgi:DNA (cytosine-5)-methyltransferase 1
MSVHRFVDLFSGIGGTRIAFEPHGECVYSCEVDKDAREVYEQNWNEKPTETDVRNIERPDEEVPDHDILLACWPCPSFSKFGKRDGLNDERGMLFYEITAILETKQPKAFMLENVKNLRFVKEGSAYETVVDALEHTGYTAFSAILNALDFGLPQHRERLILVGFRNDIAPDEGDFEIPAESKDALTTEEEQRTALANLLEDDPDDKYEASTQVQLDRIKAVSDPFNVPEPSVWHENRAGQVEPRPYSSALRASSSWNYILVNGRRHPTVQELLRLQGIPEWFKIDDGNRTRARKLTGNTVPVPVIQAVAEALTVELDSPKTRPVSERITNEIDSDQ